MKMFGDIDLKCSGKAFTSFLAISLKLMLQEFSFRKVGGSP